MRGAGEIKTPEVGFCEGGAGILGNDVPAVVEIQSSSRSAAGGGGDGSGKLAGLRVIPIGDQTIGGTGAGGSGRPGGTSQAVFSVPSVDPLAV